MRNPRRIIAQTPERATYGTLSPMRGIARLWLVSFGRLAFVALATLAGWVTVSWTEPATIYWSK